MFLKNFKTIAGDDSLSPPKRREGWGEGIVNRKTIGLLTPALSSRGGGEGENLSMA